MSELITLRREEIARRVAIARKLAGKTREEAAKSIGVSESTLASIENGSRDIHLRKVKSIAHCYGTTINQLLRPSAVYMDISGLVPRFKMQQETKYAHVLEAVQRLHSLISAEVELERLLKIGRKTKYPRSVNVVEGDIVKQAEIHALKLRKVLDLGHGPISDIFSIIEDKLGIRLYRCHLSKDSKVSGLYTYDKKIGACILLNANHSLNRQHMSAAHELGHFYSNREHSVLDEDNKKVSREERYADRFSIAFLMPREGFSGAFNEICKGSKPLTKDFKKLAKLFNVSLQACVMRLEDLKLVENGTWKITKSEGGADKLDKNDCVSTTGRKENAKVDALNHSLPLKISVLAHEAWERGFFTEGQLSYLLQLDRIELRKLFFDIENKELEIAEFYK